MRPAAVLWVPAITAMTFFNAGAVATSTSIEDRALVKELYIEGMDLLDSDSLDAAAANFRAALEIDGKHAPSYVGLGHVHLKSGDLKAAERAFMDARRRQHRYAPAYNGLGLVWREKPKGLYTAIDYFKKALQYDRNYLEARYHIAEARYAMGEHDVGREAGAFVPDVARLDVPQGNYRMEVMARDMRTGRRGRYRQTIQVEAYPETGLRMSDLELAWRISETSLEDKFSKGELYVVPMPTRTYGKGHNVYVYYEIYNLARDTFGQTRYRVAYTVGEEGKPGIGNIARLVRLRGNRRAEVEVAYELVGTQRSEVEYVALQLGQRNTGRQVLQVAVTDVNSGETVIKDAAFVVK